MWGLGAKKYHQRAGLGAKAWKLWVACKRVLLGGVRLILKRSGVPASPEGGLGHRSDARAQGGWRAAAGALLPPRYPPSPGAAPRREGARQAGAAAAAERGAETAAVMARGGGTGPGAEAAAWARASCREP